MAFRRYHPLNKSASQNAPFVIIRSARNLSKIGPRARFALLQGAFELSFAHPRTPWNVSPLCLSVKLCPRLPIIGSLAPILLGCTPSFARLRPLQICPIFLLALVFLSAGFAQPDCDRLLRVPHLSAATGFEFSVFELVHDAADCCLLRLGLMSRHWLTSRHWIIVKIVRRPVSVPDSI